MISRNIVKVTLKRLFIAKYKILNKKKNHSKFQPKKAKHNFIWNLCSKKKNFIWNLMNCTHLSGFLSNATGKMKIKKEQFIHSTIRWEFILKYARKLHRLQKEIWIYNSNCSLKKKLVDDSWQKLQAKMESDTRKSFANATRFSLPNAIGFSLPPQLTLLHA